MPITVILISIYWSMKYFVLKETLELKQSTKVSKISKVCFFPETWVWGMRICSVLIYMHNIIIYGEPTGELMVKNILWACPMCNDLVIITLYFCREEHYFTLNISYISGTKKNQYVHHVFYFFCILHFLIILPVTVF